MAPCGFARRFIWVLNPFAMVQLLKSQTLAVSAIHAESPRISKPSENKASNLGAAPRSQRLYWKSDAAMAF
jgi:hypothetical protein